MKNISTIYVSIFLVTSFMMVSFMMLSLMAGLRAVLKRHGRKIGKKNPYDNQDPNPFWEHFPVFPF